MLILDRMSEGEPDTDPLHSFALDELLCRQAGEGGPPIIHLWRHPSAFILGQRDNRLPHVETARRQLEALRYHTAVRNSGGAAVPLDPGVVNVSLIVPIGNAAGMRFNHDFERMYELISLALSFTGCRVDKGEIAGAYCPGDYDLSIDGRKFCGIAQRRQAKALIVQAFVVAEGSGSERAALVRAFYDVAAGSGGVGSGAAATGNAVGETSTASGGGGNADGSAGAPSAASSHPIVVPESTASLEELTTIGPDAAITFAERVKAVIRACQQPDAVADSAARLKLPPADQLEEMIASLHARYTR
ncbi:lipoate--protein ligase family protein [Paenibacillus sp. CCS19]|uniref:lipoate--protein ligase family protein n=1 Tax=Paenibacillus sp. CCS19 TaxID=3158387 RepID=UPI00295E7C32|nr:lipoate--protein ligase family protein [Paenibacillus cellulosilyticus]